MGGGLADISGLSSVKGKLAGAILIQGNDNLFSLDGLQGITGLHATDDEENESLMVFDNPRLVDSTAITRLVHFGEVPGVVEVHNNGKEVDCNYNPASASEMRFLSSSRAIPQRHRAPD